MTLIKNIFKIFAVSALFSSANLFAADFLVNTSIDDSGDYVNGGTPFAIDKMDVKWADSGLITVDIYTNFVGNNNEYYGGNGNGIVFGDLLIGTNGADTSYDYAFVLSEGSEGRGGDFRQDYHFDSNAGRWRPDNHWDKQGTLTEISSTKTTDDYHKNDRTGEVMAGNTVGNGRQGDWSVDNFSRHSGQTDKISFSFNVSGIDAFQNASQLAFSWAMSCANDVVDGVVNVNRPNGGTTKVPEPTTLLLMLLALAFMAKIRSKKSNDFSA